MLLVLTGCASAADESQPAGSEIAVTQSTEPTETAQESTPSENEADDAASEDESAAGTESETQESQTATTATAEAQASSPSPSPAATATQTPTATATATATPSPSPTATEAPAAPVVVGYTLAEVAQRNTSSNCWVAIDGGVYDLTMWIRSHPGGSGAIIQLCGTDGTQQFLGQHGGQARPASVLDGYYIGPLR
jgi:cytochrome b involved in lipid metabolism